MGIDISGCMIVGEYVKNMAVGTSSDTTTTTNGWLNEDWCEEHDVDFVYPYFDCPFEDAIVGFQVEDVIIGSMHQSGWYRDMYDKAIRFEELFGGTPARLIGSQDVW